MIDDGFEKRIPRVPVTLGRSSRELGVQLVRTWG